MVSSRLVEVAHAGGDVVQFRQTRTHWGRPVYWVSSYWVDGVLIDAGPRWTRVRLLRVLQGRKVDAICVTHEHEDHVGNIGPLQAASEAPAYASAEAARRTREPYGLAWYRRHVWGEPDPGWIQDLPRRIQTKRHSLDVVAVPGHTPGDVAFVEPSHGWAFTGDLFLSPRQTVLMRQEDLALSLRSLERLRALEPRVLFTGMHVFKQALQVIDERLAFLKQVIHKCNVLRKQDFTQNQIRRKLLGHEPFLYYFSGGEFGKRHLVTQAFDCDDLHLSRGSEKVGRNATPAVKEGR